MLTKREGALKVVLWSCVIWVARDDFWDGERGVLCWMS